MLFQGRDGYLYHRAEQRPFPPSDEPSLARAQYVQAVLHDPAGARRERLREQARYWRNRLARLHQRAELLRELLPDAEAAPPEHWRARAALAVAEGDMLEAAWRLQQLDQALGERSAPLPAVPAPLIAPAGPRKPGPKVTCQCGECQKCRARMAMRRRRAERKAKATRKARRARRAAGQ
jgi:hypothetical protein